MALLDDIMGQLTGMGFGTGGQLAYGDISEINPEDIAGRFAYLACSLLGGLQSAMGGQKGQQAYGGFAGSGQATQFGQQAKDVYGKGMSDVLAQTGQQQMKGLTGIQDVINQWKETAMRIRGDI